jgi:hypothetical protein
MKWQLIKFKLLTQRTTITWYNRSWIHWKFDQDMTYIPNRDYKGVDKVKNKVKSSFKNPHINWLVIWGVHIWGVGVRGQGVGARVLSRGVKFTMHPKNFPIYLDVVPHLRCICWHGDYMVSVWHLCDPYMALICGAYVTFFVPLGNPCPNFSPTHMKTFHIRKHVPIKLGI